MNAAAVQADRVITPGRLRRGLRCSIAASSVGMVWVAIALNMPFTMLMAALVAITAETLGHFGDISAVYEILPRFRTAVTPFMRRALAAACGDLLGQPDRFYELLTRFWPPVGGASA